jgi:hypothetical protein
MDNRTRNRNDQGNFLTRRLAIPAWLLLLLVVVTVLIAVLRITVPSFLWVLIALLLLLVGWLSGQGGSSPGSPKELSDPDARDYRIRVSNYPNYANPTLLRIEDRNRLLDLNREPELGIVTSVAGDLVFAVNRFDPPVNLVMNYTAEDEQKLQERRKRLGSPVELVPIYLHSPTTEEGGVAIWRPFQDFTIDAERREATIRVSSWGDSPTGWGTRP